MEYSEAANFERRELGWPLPPWGLSTVLWGIGYAVLVIVVALIVVGVIFVAADTDTDSGEATGIAILAQGVANLVILGGIFWSVSKKGASLSDFGLRSFDAGWWWLVPLFVIGSYLTLGTYGIIVEALGFDILEPESNIQEELADSTLILVLAGIMLVVVAPVTEELFFRGFVLPGVAQKWGLVAGILASAIFFGLVHGQLGLLIPFSLIGVYFALIYLRVRSIWVPILCHLSFNTIGFVALALS